MHSTSSSIGAIDASSRPWHMPFYRNAAISLFLSGMGISAAQPLLTLFFVDHLHVSLSVASLYFLTALAGLPISVITGRLSDHLPGRMPLIRAATLWVPIGWILLSLTQQMGMVFVIGIIWFSFGATVNAQTFAAVRDDLIGREVPGHGRLLSNIRVAYALGWVVGPIFGSWFGLRFGIRPLFLATAALYLLSLAPIARFSIPRVHLPSTVGDQHRKTEDSTRTLLLFVGLCIVAMSGETLKWSFLPIYMEENLSAPSWMRGAVISTPPFLELLLIPLGGWLAERVGAYRMVLIGVAAGAIAHLLFATSTSMTGLFLGQVFCAILFATVLSIGMVVAQNYYPRGPGFATSVFVSGLGLSSTVGGLLASSGVGWLGLPHVFFLSAITSTIALVGLVMLGIRSRSLQAESHQTLEIA